MYEIMTALLASLNAIEVHGSNNLALLFNAIDTIKQLQQSFAPKKTDDKEPDLNVATVEQSAAE